VYGLDGKVAVVTGGGRGIGRGVAFGLGEAGAKVFVNDYYRGEARGAAEDVADEIHVAGGIAVANGEDISSFAGGAALIEAARKEFGRVDILVTCAGNFWPDMTLDVTEERWNAQLAVHATGTFACAQAAAKLMVEQGDGGRIITFSSRGAFFGPTPAYAAAKGAVMAMTAALSADLSARGITANCVLPSATTQLFPGDDASARTFGGVAAAESLNPNDIAPLIVYLATPLAGQITGRFIYAAGGDICVYPLPTSVGGGGTTYLRKPGGRWTVDEIADVLPAVIGVGGDAQIWNAEKVTSLSNALFKGSK
jgi:NAD(P)-dependent dehydrogenase (short-subunit alcohol dehydrogenase family)